MAVTETPPETVQAASEQDPEAPRPQPTGLAAVLGTGDHKVIGRLYVASALILGFGMLALGQLFAVEAISTATLDVFSRDTVFQAFTLFRVGSVFLLALPLVIGVAFVVVPLQIGSRAIAFPRAAAASYWGWLLGSGLLIASYLMNGGPGGGDEAGVNLWIASLGLIVLSILAASVCLVTTVLALRHTGLSISRIPLFAWSVAVAGIMWLLTLPVLLGLLALVYVDHRHGGDSIGTNAGLYGHLQWVLRNPQIYTVAIPVLGFAADVLATTARTRVEPRFVAQGAIGAFGILGFGAFLAGSNTDVAAYETWVVIGMGLAAVLPVLAILGLAGDLFRRGSFRLNAGALYATASLLVLLLGVGAGALGSFPGLETTNTIFDLGVTHAVVLATIIASVGGLHWWATKVGRQPANEGIGRIAPLVLLAGSAAVVIPDLASGLLGDGTEVRLDWTGGIEGLNVVVAIGTALVALGLLAAVVSLLPLLKTPDAEVASDPWEGQSLEWLAPSPPPLDNFVADLPVVTSAEPLVDLREES
jgi:heme/copper-type cytochrome/quinol oxidase subunit 1